MKPGSASAALSSTQITLLIAGLVSIMPFSIDIYLPALGAMAGDLGSSVHHLEQSVSSFYLGIALGQILGAPFSDRFGRRIPVLLGLGIFSVFSLLLTLATTASIMIGLRFMQALGAGIAVVNAAAIVRDCFDEVGTAKAFANIAVVMMIAPMISPLIGASLLELFHWQSIFIFLGLYGILQMIILYRQLPETRELRTTPVAAFGYRHVLSSTWSNVLVLSLSFTSIVFLLYLTDASFIYLEYYQRTPIQFAWIFSLGVFMLVTAHQCNRLLLGFYRPRRILLYAIPLQTTIAFIIYIYCRFYDPQMWPLFGLIMTMACVTQIINANGLAIFLSLHPDHSGKANAILGSLRFVIGGVFGFLLVMTHQQHPVSFATFSLFGAVTGALLFALCRWRSDIFGRANTH